MNEFVVEGRTVVGRFEVALSKSPVADGFGDASDELANSGLALGSTDFAVQIFAGNDVGRGHGPVFWNFDVFLFEDYVAFGVGNLGESEIPLEFVVGRDTWLSEKAAEREAGGGLLRLSVRRSGHGDGSS